MGLLVKQFTDSSDDPVVGLHVALTEIGTNQRIKYRFFGLTSSHDEDLITDADGIIIADIDAETFQVTAFNSDRDIVFQEIMGPVINTLGYTSDLLGNPFVVQIRPTVLALDFEFNGAAQTLNVAAMLSDNSWVNTNNGYTSLLSGDECVEIAHNDTTGVLTVTPVEDISGVAILTLSAAHALTVVLTFTVAEEEV